MANLLSQKKGFPLVNLQKGTANQCSNNFIEKLSMIIEKSPSIYQHGCLLEAAYLDTPLGQIIAIADGDALYLLEFIDWHELERKILQLRRETQSVIIFGKAAAFNSIEQELKLLKQDKTCK